jgi:hypothetical protein
MVGFVTVIMQFDATIAKKYTAWQVALVLVM